MLAVFKVLSYVEQTRIRCVFYYFLNTRFHDFLSGFFIFITGECTVMFYKLWAYYCFIVVSAFWSILTFEHRSDFVDLLEPVKHIWKFLETIFRTIVQCDATILLLYCPCSPPAAEKLCHCLSLLTRLFYQSWNKSICSLSVAEPNHSYATFLLHPKLENRLDFDFVVQVYYRECCFSFSFDT